VAFFGSRKNYFFSSAGAAAGAALSAGAGAAAAGAAAGASAAGAGASFLPQATKAAANRVAKRSDFFMGDFPLLDTKTIQGEPQIKINSKM
jgi:hypothetical protein